MMDPVDATGWRPIETAPKEEANAILLGWDTDPTCIAVGFYALAACFEPGWVDGGDRDMETLRPQPTHWMPLPRGPEKPRGGD